jgi:hypothetical protein
MDKNISKTIQDFIIGKNMVNQISSYYEKHPEFVRQIKQNSKKLLEKLNEVINGQNLKEEVKINLISIQVDLVI